MCEARKKKNQANSTRFNKTSFGSQSGPKWRTFEPWNIVSAARLPLVVKYYFQQSQCAKSGKLNDPNSSKFTKDLFWGLHWPPMAPECLLLGWQTFSALLPTLAARYLNSILKFQSGKKMCFKWVNGLKPHFDLTWAEWCLNSGKCEYGKHENIPYRLTDWAWLGLMELVI